LSLCKYPNPPHKHAELIKAWADGAEIEYNGVYDEEWQRLYDGKWQKVSDPSWPEHYEYRIKPEKSEKELEIERIESEMRKLADDLAAVKNS
jgi:hypothetical protein